MKKALIFLTILSIPLGAICQVEIKDAVKFNASAGSNRQVENLGNAQAGNDAINVAMVQKNSLIYAPATGTANNLIINLPMITAQDTGHIVSVKIGTLNTGAVTIQLNSFAAAQLLKYASSPLDSADLRSGMIITAMFDGSAYQLLSPLNHKCPQGFVDVTKDFCIQVDEQDSLDFFNAAKACFDISARLCSYSEWYYACMKNGLGLNDLLNNFEWTGTAANSNAQAQTKGVDLNGVPGCDRGRNQNVTAVNSYRCCYSKRR